MKTYTAKPADIDKKWILIDAEGVVLGRLATIVASRLRGKHKPIYAPHADTGDFVVIINADKVAVSGNKKNTKILYTHSGYPGGLSQRTVGQMLETKPERLVEKAITGMLPHGPLGRSLSSKLKVYAGPTHPHAAQKPEPFEITQVAQ